MLRRNRVKGIVRGAAGLATAIVLMGRASVASRIVEPSTDRHSTERKIPATRYRILRAGPPGGEHPSRNSLVKLRYTGRFSDGTVFGTSTGNGPDGTTIFPQYMLIPGCQSVLMLMRPGDRWEVSIPPEQAYGFVHHPLAGKTLLFDLELVDFSEQPAVPLPTFKGLPRDR